MTKTQGRAPVEGGSLEYEIHGEGEPVLLIHGSHVARAFAPLLDEDALQDYRLIRYHRRGYAGSVSHDGPFSIAQQAADAHAVLQHLAVSRAHIVGHSYGAVIALQMAIDSPAVVGSLALLEPPLLMVPQAEAFARDYVEPAVERYQLGDPAGAVDVFGRGIGGAEWKQRVEEAVPGGVEQAEADAATFFEVELDALGQWEFTPEHAARIPRPVLFVIGAETHPLYEEVGDLVQGWLPQTEACRVPGATHLLQVQAPAAVAEGIANFLDRHPLDG